MSFQRPLRIAIKATRTLPSLKALRPQLRASHHHVRQRNFLPIEQNVVSGWHKCSYASWGRLSSNASDQPATRVNEQDHLRTLQDDSGVAESEAQRPGEKEVVEGDKEPQQTLEHDLDPMPLFSSDTPATARTIAETRTLITGEHGWELLDRIKLYKRFLFPSFKKAWSFMTVVAEECRVKRHHPEWKNAYNVVEIVWTTHKPEGLSSKDLEMAEFCDSKAKDLGVLPLLGTDPDDNSAQAKKPNEATTIDDGLASDLANVEEHRIRPDADSAPGRDNARQESGLTGKGQQEKEGAGQAGQESHIARDLLMEQLEAAKKARQEAEHNNKLLRTFLMRQTLDIDNLLEAVRPSKSPSLEHEAAKLQKVNVRRAAAPLRARTPTDAVRRETSPRKKRRAIHDANRQSKPDADTLSGHVANASASANVPVDVLPTDNAVDEAVQTNEHTAESNTSNGDTTSNGPPTSRVRTVITHRPNWRGPKLHDENARSVGPISQGSQEK